MAANSFACRKCRVRPNSGRPAKRGQILWRIFLLYDSAFLKPETSVSMRSKYEVTPGEPTE